MKQLLLIIIASFILAISIISTVEFKNDIEAVKGLVEYCTSCER